MARRNKTTGPQKKATAPAKTAGRPTPQAHSQSAVDVRGVLAVAIVAAIAYLCSSYGMVYGVPNYVCGLLVGAIAGLLARDVVWHPVSAGAAVLIAAALFPGWDIDPSGGIGPRMLAAAAVGALTALTAAAISWIVHRGADRQRVRWIVAICIVASIVALSCYTTLAVDSAPVHGTYSVSDLLRQDAVPNPALGAGDERVYLQIFTFTHSGSGYYDAVRQAWANNYGGLPWGVTSYRMPTIFWLWKVLPSDPATIVWLFLAFSTVAIASAFAIGAQLAGPGPGCLGALAVAAYYLFVSTSWAVTYVDPWGMAIGLLGVALFVTAVRRRDSRLIWAAAAVIALASLFREHMLYISAAAAAASALTAVPGKRVRSVVPWLASVGVFVAAYAMHYVGVGGRISPKSDYGMWLRGGLEHLYATLIFSQDLFTAKQWLLPVLVGLALVGAVALWRTPLRVIALFAGIAVGGMLVAFLFVGNGGRNAGTGQIVGYWGMLVVPLALAFMPTSLLWLDPRLAQTDA